jgi:hypothetical protein
MTSRTKYVPELLGALATAITVSPLPLTAQAVGNALYGLQGMNSEVEEVRAVLKALTNKIKSMPTPHLRPMTRQQATNMNKKKADGSDVGSLNKGTAGAEVGDNGGRSSNISNSTATAAAITEQQSNEQKNKSEDSKTVTRSSSSSSAAEKEPPLNLDYMMTGQNIGNALW